MKDSRKRYNSSFKAAVAMAAMKGEQTLAEIAQKYQIHPSQIKSWKAEVLKGLPGLFDGKEKKYQEKNEQDIAYLERKIGQLTVENDYLKKSWEKSQQIRGGK